MIVAYIRTYANQQSTDDQQEIISNFAKSHHLEIDKWHTETGNSPRANRKIEIIIQSLKAGDQLLVADSTRLSRKLVDITHYILLCIQKQITLNCIREDYTFDNNIGSKTLAFTFGMVSEIERKLISIRTKEALVLSKSKGVVLGRPRRKQQDGRLFPYKEEIMLALKDENTTYPILCQKYNVAISTLKRFIKDYITNPIPEYKKRRKKMKRKNKKKP